MAEARCIQDLPTAVDLRPPVRPMGAIQSLEGRFEVLIAQGSFPGPSVSILCIRGLERARSLQRSEVRRVGWFPAG